MLASPFAVSAPAPGEPSPPAAVTLYAHWRDIINRAPLNTIPPDPATEPDLNEGFQMPTVVLRTPCGDLCNVTFQNNMFTLYTFPRAASGDGRVDYEAPNPSYDVELADGPILAYLYLSAHSLPDTIPDGPPTNAGVVPLVQVDAVWETGRVFGGGYVIAAGSTGRTVNLIHAPGGETVYEVVVPMGRFLDTIPSDLGTVFTVRLHQVASDFAEVQQSSWRIRTGADYPWRIVVPVENPLVKRDLSIWVKDGQAHVRWGVKAAFGAYDINASSFRLEVFTDRHGIFRPPTEVEYSRLQNPEIKTVYAHWSLPLEDLAASKEWNVRTSVKNLQDTTGLEAQGRIFASEYHGANEIPIFGSGGGEDVKIVTPWIAIAFLGLVAVAVVGRRRRGP